MLALRPTDPFYGETAEMASVLRRKSPPLERGCHSEKPDRMTAGARHSPVSPDGNVIFVFGGIALRCAVSVHGLVHAAIAAPPVLKNSYSRHSRSVSKVHAPNAGPSASANTSAPTHRSAGLRKTMGAALSVNGCCSRMTALHHTKTKTKRKGDCPRESPSRD